MSRHEGVHHSECKRPSGEVRASATSAGAKHGGVGQRRFEHGSGNASKIAKLHMFKFGYELENY
jgi:hypothetical protein